MKRVNLLWKKRTATRNEVINGRGCFWITSDPFSIINFINKVFMLQTICCCYHTHEFQIWPVISLKWHSMIMIMFIQWQLNRRSRNWVIKWLSKYLRHFRIFDHSYTQIIKRIYQRFFFQSNHVKIGRCVCGGKSCWVLFVNKVFVRLGKSSQWKIWYSDKFLSRRLKYFSAAFNNTWLPRFKYSSSLKNKHPFIPIYKNVSLNNL